MEKIYQHSLTDTSADKEEKPESPFDYNKPHSRRAFLVYAAGALAGADEILNPNTKPNLLQSIKQSRIAEYIKQAIEFEKQVKYNLDVLDRLDTAIYQKASELNPNLVSDEEQISLLCNEFNTFFENPLNHFQGDFFKKRQEIFRSDPETIRQNLWSIEVYFSLCGFFAYIRLIKNYGIYEINMIITEDPAQPRKPTANLPESSVLSHMAVIEPIPDDLIALVDEYLPENTLDIHEIAVTHVLFPFYISSYNKGETLLMLEKQIPDKRKREDYINQNLRRIGLTPIYDESGNPEILFYKPYKGTAYQGNWIEEGIMNEYWHIAFKNSRLEETSVHPETISLPALYFNGHKWLNDIPTEAITVHRINELLSDVTELRVLYNRIPKGNEQRREHSEERYEFNGRIKNLINNMESRQNMFGYYLSYAVIPYAFKKLVEIIQKLPSEKLDRDFPDLKQLSESIASHSETAQNGEQQVEYYSLVDDLPLALWKEFLWNEEGSVETIAKYLLNHLRQSKSTEPPSLQTHPAKKD